MLTAVDQVSGAINPVPALVGFAGYGAPFGSPALQPRGIEAFRFSGGGEVRSETFVLVKLDHYGGLTSYRSRGTSSRGPVTSLPRVVVEHCK